MLYESTDTLEPAIRSLSLIGSGVRLAIHDNSSRPLALDSVGELAARMRMPIRVERCGTNCGFARACNSLARGSSAEWLLFLNPDAELLTWPNRPSPEAAGIIGPLVFDTKQHLTVTWGRRRSIAEEFMLRWTPFRPRLPKGFGYVSGCALLVSQRTFTELGGFDEHFFMYYEDIDLCLRANRAGTSVTVDPKWKVRHLGAASAGRDFGTALIRSYQSAAYFFSKHGQNGGLYRFLCRVDARLRLTLFALLPSRRRQLPAMRQLSEYLAATPVARGSESRNSGKRFK